MIRAILFLFLCGTVQILEAQIDVKYWPTPDVTTREAIKQADQFYEKGLPNYAYIYYKKAAQKRKRSKSINYYLGETALKVRDYKRAKSCFEKVLKRSFRFPLVRFYYALSLKHTGAYEQAQKEFTQFLDEDVYFVDAEYVTYANQEISACANAMEQRKSTQRYVITKLGIDVNTIEDEVSPAIMPDGKRFLIGHRGKLGLLVKVVENNKAKNSGGSWGNPLQAFTDPYISPDGQTVYFSRFEPDESDVWHYQLYTAVMKSDGSITGKRKLGDEVNKQGFNSAQPCLAVTDNGQEILYFSADFSGGEGGYDLWYSVKLNNGTFSKAFHMGSKLNSPMDEVTPYFHQPSGILYFSSNARKGFGGFDVYRAKGEKRYWSKPLSMGYPINSEVDDYYFILKDDSKSGYMVSNRENTAGQVYDNCCDDVFEVQRKF